MNKIGLLFAIFKLAVTASVQTFNTRMKTTIKLTTIALFVGVIMASCGTNSNKIQDSAVVEELIASFPAITQNGIEPFLLGTYAPDIPPQGEWYDNIEIVEEYEVMYGMLCNIMTVSAEELKEMQENDMINDIISHRFGLIVKKGEVKLMSIECDDNRRISKITVKTPDFKMSNGVCVGMSIEDISKFSKAILKMNGMTTSDAHLAIEIQGIPSNILVNLSDNNGIMGRYFSGEQENLTDNWKELDWGWEIPIEEDRGDDVVSIVIQ